MNRNEQSLDQLIHKDKYHSCLLTTFSFDPTFFEMKSLRMLRSKGVSNINVLVDGNMFDANLDTQVNQFKRPRSYSIIPIYMSKSFHPKIWILIGPKDALLIVGSGNLTSSGQGGNDELWSAFHIGLDQTNYLRLLQKAYQYLIQHINAEIKEVNQKITAWIKHHSELPFDINNGAETTDDSWNTHNIDLLLNNKDNSIWEELNQRIPNQDVNRITLGAPYFDKNGRAVELIQEKFPNAKVHIILDERGTIPKDIANPETFNFYRWENLIKNNSGKLHAKFLHFQCKDGIEYLLTGSANITLPGLGMLDNANSEACILQMKRNAKFLNGLGIKVDKFNSKSFSEFKAFNPEQIEVVNSFSANDHRILYVSVYSHCIKLYLSRSVNQACNIQLLDSESNLLHKINCDSITSGEQFTGLPEDIDDVTYLLISDKENNPISNKQILHSENIINKTYPSPRLAAIEQAISDIDLEGMNGIYRYTSELFKQDIHLKSSANYTTSVSQGSTDSEEHADQLYHLGDFQSEGEVSNNIELKKMNCWSYRFYIKLIEGEDQVDKTIQREIDEEEQLANPEKTGGGLLPDRNITDDNDAPQEPVDNEEEKEKKLRQLQNFFKKATDLFQEKEVNNIPVTLDDLFRFFLVLEVARQHLNKRIKVYKTIFNECYIYPFHKDRKHLTLEDISKKFICPFLKRIALNKEVQREFKSWRKSETREIILIIQLLILTNWNRNEINDFRVAVKLAMRDIGGEFPYKWNLLKKKLNEIHQKMEPHNWGYRIFEKNLNSLISFIE